MERELLIFFGKAGAGKNFVAGIFEREFGYCFYDADQDLTQEMIGAIYNNQRFTDKMRDEYFEVVKIRVKELLKTKDKVVLTQGLFKNKHRFDLLKEFPFAKFVWIDADQSILESRIVARNDFITKEYAQKINSYFEEPEFVCSKIMNNDGEAEILRQALMETKG
jgi:gluconokinase